MSKQQLQGSFPLDICRFYQLSKVDKEAFPCSVSGEKPQVRANQLGWGTTFNVLSQGALILG